MKREGLLLRHLRRSGCVLRREGKEHALWENPQTWSSGGSSATLRNRQLTGKEGMSQAVDSRFAQLTSGSAFCAGGAA
jgi:hypothetical protein